MQNFLLIFLLSVNLEVNAQIVDRERFNLFDISNSRELLYDYVTKQKLSYEEIIGIMSTIDTIHIIPCNPTNYPSWFNFRYYDGNDRELTVENRKEIVYLESGTNDDCLYYGVEFVIGEIEGSYLKDTLFKVREDSILEVGNDYVSSLDSNPYDHVGYRNTNQFPLGVYNIDSVKKGNEAINLSECSKSRRIQVMPDNKIIQYFGNYMYSCRSNNEYQYVEMICDYYITKDKSLVLFDKSERMVEVLKILNQTHDKLELENKDGLIFLLERNDFNNH